MSKRLTAERLLEIRIACSLLNTKVRDVTDLLDELEAVERWAAHLEATLHKIIKDGTDAKIVDGAEHVTHTEAALIAFTALSPEARQENDRSH